MLGLVHKSIAAHPSWRALVSAIDSHRRRDFGAMCTFANTAVESFLKRTIGEYARTRWFEKSKLKMFMKLDYMSHLKLVLPMLLDTLSDPIPMPNKWMRRNLQELLERRNQVNHQGTFEDDLTDELALDLIVTAVLGMQYTRLLAESCKKTLLLSPS